MKWNSQIRDFVTEHLNDDTAKLLFASHRYPEIDMPFAVEQIEARKRVKNKLPEWFALPDLIMGGRIPAEQCSSEQTARFKRTIMGDDCHSLCDMTGGMGVDFWYMSRGLDRAIYTERQEALCVAARHNFDVLQKAEALQNPGDVAICPAIEIREGLSTEMPVPDVDVIYLDPARRSTDGSRIYEIEDCEPNIVEWQDELLSHCHQLIVKVSPMADIKRTIARMHNVTDIYVVAVRNECKELLIVQKSAVSESIQEPIKMHCVDFFPQKMVSYEFSQTENEKLLLADVYKLSDMAMSQYFYEPDVSVMKAQAFYSLMSRYHVAMIGKDSHYFTSKNLEEEFPGRSFTIDEVLVFSSGLLKQLKKKLQQANVATRNFPLSAEELRKRAGIRDGGDVYLFGTTHDVNGPLLIICHKL